MRLFGTDGIRGEVGKYPLTVENVLKLAKASALVLKKKIRSLEWLSIKILGYQDICSSRH